MVLSNSEKKWLASIPSHGVFISIQHPNWKGIKSSSNQLFEYHYDIADNLSNEEIEHHAQLLLASPCKGVVLQGFPNSFYYLIEYINKIKPDFPIFLIYHGNFMHTPEDYSWWAFKSIVELSRSKKIKKVGFVKKGMAEIMANQGLSTAFIKNYYNVIPETPSNVSKKHLNIGIWTNGTTWQKSPYAMIAAVSMFKDAVLHGSGFNQRSIELCLLMGIDYKVEFQSIPHEKLLNKMANMHLNLYVTFSECAPMLPLESFSKGVPCLIGPNNHYFEDNDYLHSRCVVPYPDKAYVISKMAEMAISERTKIVKEYIKYAEKYNLEAKKSVIDFLTY